jgi:hypothetical protein
MQQAGVNPKSDAIAQYHFSGNLDHFGHTYQFTGRLDHFGHTYQFSGNLTNYGKLTSL